MRLDVRTIAKTTKIAQSGWRVVVLATLVASWSTAALATEEPPPPTPSPGLRLSDKAPPGCCCIVAQNQPAGAGCSYGLHEEKCQAAGRFFADRTTTWTPGKCPVP